MAVERCEPESAIGDPREGGGMNPRTPSSSGERPRRTERYVPGREERRARHRPPDRSARQITEPSSSPGSWQTGEVSFESVYQRFRTPVWRLALRMTADREEALEACQEIFLRVWKGLPGFRGGSRLSTWVFQIAWNVLRSRARRRALEAGRLGTRAALEVAELLPDPGPDPERRSEAEELVERVERCLRRLPELQRVALWLFEGEGLSYEEIAGVLEIPVGTVRSRISRARAALRRLVEDG